MNKITELLLENEDPVYRDFQIKLTPGITAENCIGVRVPVCREMAKKVIKEDPESVYSFLKNLPHQYYDENMIHGILISEFKDFDACLEAVEKFLPYVDNWAVCDIMFPKCFKKNKIKLLQYIKKWVETEKTFTVRFGLEMLMKYFLAEDFKVEYLEIPAGVSSNEYYVNMMIAWYFATALAKQWESAFPFIKNNRLPKWTHNKTIQKAIESYRISEEQKEILRKLKY